MKYYDIVIESGRSKELKSKLPEIEAFLKEAGLEYHIFYTAQGSTSEPETVNLLINDNYESWEIAAMKKRCIAKGWKNAERILNSSKNYFQAYQKAEARLKNLKEIQFSLEDEEAEELKKFTQALKEMIFQLSYLQYKTLTSGEAEAEALALRVQNTGSGIMINKWGEYIQTIGPLNEAAAKKKLQKGEKD